MKPPAFEYLAPDTLDEALALLARHEESAKILAGGQSLVPALNFRLAYPEFLIDLDRIAALHEVVFHEDGAFDAGALARHRFFERDPRVKAAWPLLSHGAAHIAYPQVRNRGTIGGSLSHADPSAEWPALCLACDATMVIRGQGGAERLVRAGDFFQGLFATAIAPDEILVQVRFPRPPQNLAWGFQEVSRREGDFAIVGVACVLGLRDDGSCESARIVVFGATDRPELLSAAAEALLDRQAGVPDVMRAATIARGSLACRADQQASRAYRETLIETLTARALAQALNLSMGDMHGHQS